ncbi:MAG: endolytic transglycosylase MltG [Flavobacteriaceae bacterium]|nr:MAG: endolytic transglycosylase MltG [Flavobacteriaceae bacterium]
MIKKISIGVLLILLIGGVGFHYYQIIFGKTISKDGVIFIQTNSNMANLEKELTPFLPEKNHFTWLAKKKTFIRPKAGKYLLEKDMSLNDVINLLRSGNQTPVILSFNNRDTLEKLAGRVATQIEADSTTIIKAMLDSVFLKKNGFTRASALGMYIPNSYQFYWNTSAEGFRDKMKKEFAKFWNQDRINKAKKTGLKKEEVITLASIVQKETAQKPERPVVAGLYINRLKKGWPLQADPTVIYVLKQQKGPDFVIKRVLHKDLKIKSPYNTYLHRGLPPALIAMPDVSSIDAVLNYEKHPYYYMCVNTDKIGFHVFARTLRQHNRNAKKYQRWLEKKGIWR